MLIPAWSCVPASKPLRPGARGRAGRTPGYKPSRARTSSIVLVGTVNKGVIQAVQYAKSLAPSA